MRTSLRGPRWYILALVVLTNLFVVSMPMMGLSVLSKEIAQELGLSVVQIGAVWGMGALPSILMNLLGGVIVDKIGPRRVLVVATLAAGLLGAARGLAGGFFSLIIITVVMGALVPFVGMSGIKTVGMWFPPGKLGLASALISMGMALGFLLGAFLSATVLSPLLGGWRNVLILYGTVGASFSLAWLFAPEHLSGRRSADDTLSIRAAVLHVAGLGTIRLLGLTLFGVNGAIQGMLGYLPLHLRGLGWDAIHADGALSAFHLASLLFVLPIALWSDRLASRKLFLLTAAGLVAVGAFMLSFAEGALVWAAVLLAGFVRDAFMAMFITMVIESEGVGTRYAGTAIGFTLAVSGAGNLLAPPLGNSLAGLLWPGAPFLFWGALAGFALICLSRVAYRPQRTAFSAAEPLR